MIFLSLPPIAKYNVSRSIKQKIAPATSGGVSQETCTHLTCKYMINMPLVAALLHSFKKRTTKKHERLEIIRNGCLTYSVYNTVWCKL